MGGSQLALTLLFVLALFPCLAAGESSAFIDWQNLHNPVLGYSNWSIKDAAMARRGNTFYIFFSAFYQDHGQVRSHVVEVSTADFKHFSQPILNFAGLEEGWLGMCSPDVQKLSGMYVMTFNSWGFKPDKPNELFYMLSRDLIHWSRRRAIAVNLTGSNRVIDASLTAADGGFYLIWKEGPQGAMHPRLAFAKSLHRPFHYVGGGFPKLLMADGKEDGLTHENFQFVRVGGKQYLLSSDYMPQAPHLYELKPNSDWLTWVNGRMLDIPREGFNSDMLANAGALYDWRAQDDYYYLIYAGCAERKTYAKRGWNRLALARSRDLVHWAVAGKPS